LSYSDGFAEHSKDDNVNYINDKLYMNNNCYLLPADYDIATDQNK